MKLAMPDCLVAAGASLEAVTSLASFKLALRNYARHELLEDQRA
jgi:hypothetical protein